MENKEKIKVKGISVSYKRINDEDYICLTDIARAKNHNHSGQVINNWLRNNSTLEYLGLWETLTNSNFKVLEFEYFKNKCRENSFILTAQEWIEKTKAVGIVSKSGRYGGTYASEADLLNVALFGITASEWRKSNLELKGNMRDYASIEQLLVLANMESYNAMLIE